MDQRPTLTLVKDEPVDPNEAIVKSITTWVGDPKWVAEDPVEITALAHLRGWVHFGPICPLCRG